MLFFWPIIRKIRLGKSKDYCLCSGFCLCRVLHFVDFFQVLWFLPTSKIMPVGHLVTLNWSFVTDCVLCFLMYRLPIQVTFPLYARCFWVWLQIRCCPDKIVCSWFGRMNYAWIKTINMVLLLHGSPGVHPNLEKILLFSSKWLTWTCC